MQSAIIIVFVVVTGCCCCCGRSFLSLCWSMQGDLCQFEWALFRGHCFALRSGLAMWDRMTNKQGKNLVTWNLSKVMNKKVPRRQGEFNLTAMAEGVEFLPITVRRKIEGVDKSVSFNTFLCFFSPSITCQKHRENHPALPIVLFCKVLYFFGLSVSTRPKGSSTTPRI